METKCVKYVDEGTWKDFRALAIKNNIKMSILLKLSVNESEKSSRNFLIKMLSRKKTLNKNK